MKEIITNKAKRDVLAHQILDYLKDKKELYTGRDWNEGWYASKDKSIYVICNINDCFATIYIVKYPKFQEYQHFGALLKRGGLIIECGTKEMKLTNRDFYQLANEIGEKFKFKKLYNNCMIER